MSRWNVDEIPRARVTAQVVLTSIIGITLLVISTASNGEPEPWQTYAIFTLVYLTVTFIIWFPSWENL